MATLEQRVTVLEDFVKNHVATKEQVDDGLAKTVAILEKLVDGQDSLKQDMLEGYKELDKKVDGLSGEVKQLRSAVNAVEQRVTDLMNPQT